MPAPSSDGGLLLLDVTTPATSDHLDRFHDLLSRSLRLGDVAETDRLRFETAVVELVGNVIEHSRPRRHDVPVQVRATVVHDLHDAGGHALHAELTDDAEPADVDLDPATVDDTAQNGRGLGLVRACCDHLAHEASESGNRWSVRSRCTS